MRYSLAIAAAIFSVTLYFALFWGFDALRILTSPTYGLEDSWRSQVVYWIARYFGMGASGLLQLAAIAGAVKLAVAGVCAVHIFDRIRYLGSDASCPSPDHDILELALLLVVAVSIVSVAPALWEHDATVIRTSTLNLILASLAAALGALERAGAEPSADEAAAVAALHAKKAWFAPWR